MSIPTTGQQLDELPIPPRRASFVKKIRSNRQPEPIIIPIKPPDPPDGYVMSELEIKSHKQQRIHQIIEKYKTCILNYLILYKNLGQLGYLIRDDSLGGNLYSDLTNCFMNNDIFSPSEKQQILNIYIGYYNRLITLHTSGFMQEIQQYISHTSSTIFFQKYTEATLSPMSQIRKLLLTFSSTDKNNINGFAPFENYNSLVVTGFKSPENSHHIFVPPNLFMIMAEHLKCYLEYFREIEPEYDYSQMIQIPKGGRFYRRNKKSVKKKSRKRLIKKRTNKRKNK